MAAGANAVVRSVSAVVQFAMIAKHVTADKRRNDSNRDIRGGVSDAHLLLGLLSVRVRVGAYP